MSQNILTTIKNIIEILTEEEKPILPIHERKNPKKMSLNEVVVQNDIESNTPSSSPIKFEGFKHF